MVYIEYIKNAFRSQLRYRLNWCMHLFGNFITVYFQICLWSALLESRKGVVTLNYMLNYILASAMIQSLILTNTVSIINSKVGSGQIAMDFIKPIRFRLYVFCESVGNSLFSLVFTYLPVTILITVIYKSYEFWKNIDLFFIASVCLGMYLYFSIAYCLGLTCFWRAQTWILERFLNDVVGLFSGKLIPVFLLPALILSWNKWLPFQYIYYSPISLLLNSHEIGEKVIILMIQVAWCVFFTLLGVLIERRGMKKLQIQGG